MIYSIEDYIEYFDVGVLLGGLTEGLLKPVMSLKEYCIYADKVELMYGYTCLPNTNSNTNSYLYTRVVIAMYLLSSGDKIIDTDLYNTLHNSDISNELTKKILTKLIGPDKGVELDSIIVVGTNPIFCDILSMHLLKET